MQKPWSEIKRNDFAQRGDQNIRVLEVGASGKTFLGSLMNKEREIGSWHDVEELERWGWTLHGEPEKWECKNGEEYWYIDNAGVEDSRWADDSIDNRRRNGLGIYPDEASAQAMFEKLKKVVRGE